MYLYLLASLFKGYFFRSHRQRGRILSLKLSISSSQGFYNKIATSNIELVEDLLK